MLWFPVVLINSAAVKALFCNSWSSACLWFSPSFPAASLFLSETENTKCRQNIRLVIKQWNAGCSLIGGNVIFSHVEAAEQAVNNTVRSCCGKAEKTQRRHGVTLTFIEVCFCIPAELNVLFLLLCCCLHPLMREICGFLAASYSTMFTSYLCIL